jgi:threonine/homoserine/homoserine lactone efflux protein
MGILGPIFSGFSAGMAMSLMLGTVFFSIIQNSIKDNWKAGVKIAMGVVVCDLLFLLLVLAGDKYIQMLSGYKKEIAIIGGLFLVILGLVTVLKKQKLEVAINSTGKYVLNGFLLNFLNPVNFAFWVSLSTILGTEQNYDLNYKMYFFSFAVLAIFLSESLIAYGASKIKRWMTPRKLQTLNWIVGSVFIGFGLKLVWEFLF